MTAWGRQRCMEYDEDSWSFLHCLWSVDRLSLIPAVRRRTFASMYTCLVALRIENLCDFRKRKNVKMCFGRRVSKVDVRVRVVSSPSP